VALNGSPLIASTTRQEITAIENITGTSGRDHITGDAQANLLRGLAGNDIFQGSAGGDRIEGGAGSDFLVYNPFLDQMDQHVSLLRGRVWEGEAAGTRLNSIEHLTGGGGNDSLIGDHGTNRLEGGAGDDVLMGNGGNDLVYGGYGQDVAVFGYARDQYDVSTDGGVTTVAYTGAGAGDGTDLLLSIETLRFADGYLEL